MSDNLIVKKFYSDIESDIIYHKDLLEIHCFSKSYLQMTFKCQLSCLWVTNRHSSKDVFKFISEIIHL
jgi:hypothetical protein